MGATPDLFVCMVYANPVGSKHESESLFQNLTTDIAKIQTLRGIILSGWHFNVWTATLPNTNDINELCELQQVHEFAKTKQPSVVAKR